MTATTLTGRTLGSYLVGDLLGQGGMGLVYKARDTRRGRDVALKTLRPSDATAGDPERIQQEALWLSRCDNAHIVRVYDAGRADEVSYIAMELMATTLQARIVRGCADLAEWVDVATSILRGLAAAHAAGIIHRDVKPANVGVASDGTVKLLDFGLAYPLPWNPHIGDRATSAFAPGCAGSVHYMSPEQLCGDPVDERADVYSTGAVLYELATGHRPFRQTAMARLIDEILNRLPVAPSTLNWRVPPAADAVIVRALAKRRVDRFQSAAEMMDAVLNVPAVAWGLLRDRQNWQLASAGALVE